MDPRVLEAMLPYLTEHFGNPASNHGHGHAARQAVERARAQVAAALNASPEEIIFTSGATESNNLALKGSALASRTGAAHIVTVASEHKAVLDPCSSLERDGYAVTCLPVDGDGLLDPDDVARAITPNTLVVSVMLANNEIGVIQPVGEIGRICRERGVLFHTDAAQALGRIRLDAEAISADLVSLSAHKVYGPKGVGALYFRSGRARRPLAPLLDGGGHERGIRSGTLNVPGIVGFGAACEIAFAEMEEEQKRVGALRDRLSEGILAGVPDARINGSLRHRLAGNLNVSFPGIEGESLLVGLSEVSVSSSSACTSGLRAPSHVLKAIGLPDSLAFSSVRFGIGRFNTAEEIDWVAERVGAVVTDLRRLGGGS